MNEQPTPVPTPSEPTSERLQGVPMLFTETTRGFNQATQGDVARTAKAMGLLDITQERLDAYLLERDQVVIDGKMWRQMIDSMALPADSGNEAAQ